MSVDEVEPVAFAEIEAAADRLDDQSVVKHTPVEVSTSLGRMVDADVRLKMEHLQWTGSFKPRGAYNKIKQLVTAGGVDRVVAASAGNHAQGVALAASKLGVEATIVMPRNAPQTKVDATRGYGAEVELVGQNFGEAMTHAQQLTSGSGTEFVHAYDDRAIIAGQGTLGIEMWNDCSDLDSVVVPIGGGGLIAGVATALDELAPHVRVVGVQAESAATVPESLTKGIPVSIDSVDTIADGIATGNISALTLRAIQDHVDEIVTVPDTLIAQSVLILLERAKQVVEGSGAAPVAAMLSDDLDMAGETVMPLLSGGNLDMTMLQAVLIHALTAREQILRLWIRIDDVPGQLERISGIIADHDANIQTVRHDRAVPSLDVGEAYLVIQVETSGAEHAHAIVDSLETADYEVEAVHGGPTDR